MTIGNALFSRLATESFSRLQSGISGLQERIASGINDPRPSADPVRAIRLNAAQELRGSLDRYSSNAAAASDRLELTDTVLSEASGITRQLRELALQSVNGAMSSEGAEGLAIEATRLRDALLSAANRKDATGQPLFAGYGAGDAFAETPQGVRFVGDAGRSSLRLSESMTLTTSLNGAEVFSTGKGGESLFDLVDNLVASLRESVGATVETVTANPGSALLAIPPAPGVVTFGFDLEGPLGKVSVSADMASGVPGPMIEAINAEAVRSGISASLGADGVSIQLSAIGPITLTAGERSDNKRETVAELRQLNNAGQVEGTMTSLRPKNMLVENVIGGFAGAVDNLAASRAEAGALARVAERQTETLTARKLQVDLSLAKLEEIDMAAAVTELQSMLMSQEAAQQSFVRIRSTGLFDYLR